MTSASSMQEVGHSKPMLWEHPEEWGGDGSERRVQDGETHVNQRVIHINV